MDDDPEPVVVEVDRVHVVPGGGTHELSPVATVVETEEVTCTVIILFYVIFKCGFRIRLLNHIRTKFL